MRIEGWEDIPTAGPSSRGWAWGVANDTSNYGLP